MWLIQKEVISQNYIYKELLIITIRFYHELIKALTER